MPFGVKGRRVDRLAITEILVAMRATSSRWSLEMNLVALCVQLAGSPIDDILCKSGILVYRRHAAGTGSPPVSSVNVSSIHLPDRPLLAAARGRSRGVRDRARAGLRSSQGPTGRPRSCRGPLTLVPPT